MRLLSVATAVVALTFTGCRSSHEFMADDTPQIRPPQRIVEIQTIDGDVINFESDSLGYAILRDTVIERFPGHGVRDTIALSSVRVIRTNGPEPTRTFIAVLLVAGGVILVTASWIHGMHSGVW